MIKIMGLEEECGVLNSVSPLDSRPRPRVRVSRDDKGSTQNSPNSSDEQWTLLDRYLPCHYFDYMAGTSTGGLISIMLGRLSMTVDECLEAYEILSERVFGHPRWFHCRSILFFNPRDKYDPKKLEKVICDVIRQRDPDGRSSTELQQLNEDMCRT